MEQSKGPVHDIRVVEWSEEDILHVLDNTDAELNEDLLQRVHNDFILEEGEVPYRQLDIYQDDMEGFMPDDLLEEGEGRPASIDSYTEKRTSNKNNALHRYVDVLEVVHPTTGETIAEYRSKPYWE